MATIAPYDGPGIYDQPYQVGEGLEHIKQTVRLFDNKAAKIRYLTQVKAFVDARITRINNNTETNEEKFGPQHTVLASGPVTTI